MLLIPLSIGTLIVGLIAQYRSEVINFRNDEGEIEPLNAVEGDGFERVIALYFSADASVRKGFTTDPTGLEARLQKSTFAIAIRKLVASLVTLGSGGLALSLAAQDTLSDAIAGFIILADLPYHGGDQIGIQGEATWGDVVEIGLRTTRIRTRDNRMVIAARGVGRGRH